MKIKVFIMLIIVLLAMGIFSNCKKEEPKIPETDITAISEQAELLTEHLVNNAFDTDSTDGIVFGSDVEITRFILTISGYIDNPMHPYHDFVSVTPEKMYIFPLENVGRIAYELFGKDNWTFDDSIYFNEEKQQYESGLDFGIGSRIYSCKNLNAAVSADKTFIEVTFILTDNIGYGGEPGWKEYGEYKTTFEIVHENDTVFLRYTGIIPVSLLELPSNIPTGEKETYVEAYTDFMLDFEDAEDDFPVYGYYLFDMTFDGIPELGVLHHSGGSLGGYFEYYCFDGEKVVPVLNKSGLPARISNETQMLADYENKKVYLVKEMYGLDGNPNGQYGYIREIINQGGVTCVYDILDLTVNEKNDSVKYYAWDSGSEDELLSESVLDDSLITQYYDNGEWKEISSAEYLKLKRELIPKENNFVDLLDTDVYISLYNSPSEIIDWNEAKDNRITADGIHSLFSKWFEHSTEETVETQTEAVEEPYLDKLAREVLESIKAGDYKKVAEYMIATDAEAYRFIQNMTVDNYEIIETAEENEYSKYFRIKFIISKSDNEYFFVGENYWDLIVANGMELVTLFRPSNEKNLSYLNSSHGLREDKEYNFCYSFSFFLGIFETATDFGMVVGDDSFWGGLLHGIIHYYMATAPNRANTLTADIAEDYMIKTTGITDVDYTASGQYTSENFAFLVCGAHGGDWLYWRDVSKEYDESTKVYTVMIDYCADSALLVVAKTIEYKYTVNGDGTYKMLSTELLYDSGYRIKGGAV